MLESLDLTTFADRVGDMFRLVIDEGIVMDARLIAATLIATAATTAPPNGGRMPFSIIFRGPSGQSVPQRIYRLEHAQLGQLDLFLVPIGPDGVGMCYEAVFS